MVWSDITDYIQGAVHTRTRRNAIGTPPPKVFLIELAKIGDCLDDEGGRQVWIGINTMKVLL